MHQNCRLELHHLQDRISGRLEIRAVERKRASQRRYVYSARRDPLTRIDYGHYAGSWNFIFRLTAWCPRGSQLDEETRRWLAEFNRLNPK